MNVTGAQSGMLPCSSSNDILVETILHVVW